jgi:hypothetical protein
MLFTDYLSIEQQNLAGWMSIGLVSLNIVVNLLTILSPPLYKIFLKCKSKEPKEKKTL